MYGRKTVLLFLSLALGFFLFLFVTYVYVSLKYKSCLFDRTADIPHNRVGLLPGTSKYLADGRLNRFRLFRLLAARDLYHSGKIDYVLVSGDNGSRYYNEPVDIRNDLMRLGIPGDRIVLDYAGFRTLDSIVRANKIFGLDSFTIISQKFQNERAVFIAREKGIHAIAYNARDLGVTESFKTRTRELFARVLLLVDLYVLDRQPKFLGEQIRIGELQQKASKKGKPE